MKRCHCKKKDYLAKINKLKKKYKFYKNYNNIQ